MCFQVALEWPEIACSRGVELSASRHAAGLAALARADAATARRVQLQQADIIETGAGDATIGYVASLLFDENFMARLGAKLDAAPRLRTLVSLEPFPPGSLTSFELDAAEHPRVEVTWGAAHVYVYSRRRRTRARSARRRSVLGAAVSILDVCVREVRRRKFRCKRVRFFENVKGSSPP